MKIHGVKREWSHPIFCMKKHYCHHCNEMLEKTKTETIVNSKSEEAKKLRFFSTWRRWLYDGKYKIRKDCFSVQQV